jgi:hypothetical protein
MLIILVFLIINISNNCRFMLVESIEADIRKHSDWASIAIDTHAIQSVRLDLQKISCANEIEPNRAR